MMFQYLLILAFLNYVCASGLNDSYDKNIVNRCRKKIALYESMKCSRKYGGADRNCPLRYYCTFVMKTPPRMCHYQGKYYKERQKLSNHQTSSSCKAECMCMEIRSKDTKRRPIMDFHCAQIDCPLNLPSNKKNLTKLMEKSDCYEYFEKPLDECAIKHQCPPFDKLYKCKFQGAERMEGKLFTPKNKPCTRCVCQKSSKKVKCGSYKCGSELGNSWKIRNYYAPFYLPQIPCCPFSWLTPQPIDSVSLVESKKKGPKCRFGKQYINYQKNFELKQDNLRFNCTCDVPPFLTCIMIFN